MSESQRDQLWMWLLPFVTRIHAGDLQGIPQQDTVPWALLHQLKNANRLQFDALIPLVSAEVWIAIEHYTDGWHGRPISVTWEILARLARRASQVPLLYEVVWCLCTYHLQSGKSFRPAAMPPQGTWCFITIPIASQAVNAWYIGVQDESTQHLLAFRKGTRLDEARAMQHALYEALLYTLRWQKPFPERLIVPTSPPPLLASACWDMGIHIDVAASMPNPYAGWDDDLGGRKRSEANLAACFAAYLRTHGYGQVTTHYHESHTKWFLTANSDISEPTYQHPILRPLLIQVPCRIGNETIVYAGRHYREASSSPILPLFSGELVSLRPSLHTKAIAWVEWRGSLLTHVVAQEYRRRDGTLAVDWYDADESSESP